MAANPTWLAASRAAAIGWSPITMQAFPKCSVANGNRFGVDSGTENYDERDGLIHINVSGVHFEVQKWQLEKHPLTLLGSREREYFWNERRKEYFFARDANIFRYILNFYTTGRLHFPRYECVGSFMEELLYFGLSTSHVDECCFEDFRDKQRDNYDRTQCDTDEQEFTTSNRTLREKMYNIFQNPQSNFIARSIYYVTGFFIAVSVIANIVDTVHYGHIYELNKSLTLGEYYSEIFFVIDTSCVGLFTIEYVLRLYSAPSRLKFLRSVMSIIDLAAIIPYYVSLGFSDNNTFAAFVTLRVFRVFRIFKFSRHSAGLRILGATLKTCASELGFLLFSLAMAIIIFATVIYYCERNVPGTMFTSIPATFWYTIVTITTLGYGDIVPSTVLGKIIGGICSLSGVLVIALPVPVIVSNFSRIYVQNQRITKHKLMIKTRILQIQALRKAAANAYISQKRNNVIVDYRSSSYCEYPEGFEGSSPEIELTSNLFNVQQQYHLLWSLETATSRYLIEADGLRGRQFAEENGSETPPKNRVLRLVSRSSIGRRSLRMAQRARARRCPCIGEKPPESDSDESIPQGNNAILMPQSDITKYTTTKFNLKGTALEDAVVVAACDKEFDAATNRRGDNGEKPAKIELEIETINEDSNNHSYRL